MRQIKAERQNFILDIINQEKKVVASDLSVRLKVSEDTIRRDLNELDEKGFLKRVHSGAIKPGPAVVDFSSREDVSLEEKIRLAKQAVAFIKSDSVILIDGGTTNVQIIKQIPKDKRCTIATNSLPILMLLRDYPNIDVITLGGSLFKQSLVMVGCETLRQLETIHADVYFMGVFNIDDEVGVTVATLDECYTKQKMLAAAAKTVALVTREKFGTVSNYVVGGVKDITYMITDSSVNGTNLE